MSMEKFDFDQIVIGSGFGGSVSALRLSEKGYRVLVLEQGLRRADKDYPKTSWDLKNTLWATKIGLKGPTQISITNKATVLHGCGVGGGSQIYSNVHLIPPDTAFESPAWTRIHDDWKQRLSPFYALAQRMLGTTKNPLLNIADTTLRDVANDIGRGDSWSTVNTGVVFPKNGKKITKNVGDPYFSGDGPQRNSCNSCGSCNVGCRYSAKNTLMKNYLFFAERNGVEIRAESKVVSIKALRDDEGNEDGSAGYELTIENSLNRFIKKAYKLRCRGVVVSAGVMGTVPLLLKMRDKTKNLPNISHWLGQQIRTNSETLLTANNMNTEIWEAPTITSMMSSSDDTTIQINRSRKGSDIAWLLMPNVPMVEGEGFTRFLTFVKNTVLHPIKTVKMLNPVGKAKNSVVFLVMQTKEAYIHLEWRRKWYRFFSNKLTAIQKEDDEPLSVCFPSAEKVARAYCEKLDGEPGNSLLEILLGTPVTAHIMSGVPIGTNKDNGVVDESGEVFGYQNLRVLDGSVIPGNLGVNPSLTITALSEYAMSKIPVYDQLKADQIKPVRFSQPLTDQVSDLTGEGVFNIQTFTLDE